MLQDSTGCVEVTATLAIIPKVLLVGASYQFVPLAGTIIMHVYCSVFGAMDSTSYLTTKVLGIAAVDVVKAGLAEDHAQV